MIFLTRKQLREAIAIGGITGCVATLFEHPIAKNWHLWRYAMFIVAFQFGWALFDLLKNVWAELWSDEEEHSCKGVDCEVCEKEDNQ